MSKFKPECKKNLLTIYQYIYIYMMIINDINKINGNKIL